MMDGLEARGRALAAARAEAAAARLADRLGEALPGVRVTAVGSEVAIEGPGMARRAIGDPALRWIGSWLK